MTRPYGRVMVLHVVILGGGFLVQALGAPVAAIAMLVVLKTGLDLVGHLREHPVPIGGVRSACVIPPDVVSRVSRHRSDVVQEPMHRKRPAAELPRLEE